MLAAKNRHKDVVLILTKNGANLDHVNEVSVHVHSLYYIGMPNQVIHESVEYNLIRINTMVGVMLKVHNVSNKLY